MATTEKTPEKVLFDVSTGWKKTTLDTKRKDYDIAFTNGEAPIDFSNYILTSNGNNATLTAETGVQYYAMVKFSENWVVDGRPYGREEDGSMKHLSINNVDRNGYLKLTLTKIGDDYYFGTDDFYTYAKGTEAEQTVKFGLDNVDIVNMSKKETVWYDDEEEYVKMSNFSVYKSVDGGKTYKNVTADYVAAIKDAGDDYSYNEGLLTETATSDIVLKNFGKTGSVNVLGDDGEVASVLEDRTFYVIGTKGSRLDEVAYSTTKNENYNLGTGEDVIYFADEEGKLNAFGKDSVALNKGEELQLTFGDHGTNVSYSYAKKGNNAVINANTEHTMKYEQVVITGAKKITDKADENYGKWTYTKAVSEYDFVAGEWGDPTDGEVEFSDTKVKNGTTYNTYYTEGEDDVLVASGKKEPKTFDVKTTTTDSVTVKNYFKVADATSVTANTYNYYYYGYYNEYLATTLEDVKDIGWFGSSDETANQKMTGNFLNNEFYTGSGNDTVKTGSSSGYYSYYYGAYSYYDYVATSAGKDTISVDGTGVKIVNAEGLVGTSEKAADTTIKFENAAMKYDVVGDEKFAKTHVLVDNLADDVVYTKSGNDLVVESAENNSTLTVKNFMSKDYVAANTSFNNKSFAELNDDYATADFKYQLVQYGKAGKAVKFTDTVYYDDMYGDVKKDTFIFKNGGYDRAFGDEGNDTYKVQVENLSAKKEYIYLNDEKGDDKYEIKNWNENVYINDAEGKDTLSFTKNSDATLVFDVLNPNADANAVLKHSFFFMKDAADENTGYTDKEFAALRSVEVANFFAVDDEGDYVAGDGAMETLKCGNKSLKVDDEFFTVVNEIKEKVSGWLATTDYDSAAAVFASENLNDINTLYGYYSIDLDSSLPANEVVS